MTQKVAVPLYKLEINYIVRRGRRWSAVEHLLLWACATPRTSKNLAVQSGMPLRMVSEALLNLLRVGWIELRIRDNETLFASTHAGRMAAAKSTPDHMLEDRPKTAQLYQERLTGELFAASDLSIKTRKQLLDSSVHFIDARMQKPDVISPSLVDRLPLRHDETFARLVDMPHPLPGDLYAVLKFDENGIEGLPEKAPAGLHLAITSELESNPPAESAAGNIEKPRLDTRLGATLASRGMMQSIDFTAADLVVGGAETLTAARTLINGARHVVIIHSTFIGKHIVNLLPTIEAAAEAGADVYINWGRSDDPETIEPNPSEVNARLAVGKLSAKARGKIILGRGTTGSHAKVIIADTGNGGDYAALLGSCNWLDSPYQSIEASLLVREARFISSIAAAIAHLIAPAVDTDPVVSRLLDIHGQTASRPVTEEGTHQAMLVLDEDHYAAVRDAMNEASDGEQILLSSHKIGHSGEITVFDPMRAAAAAGVRIDITYSRVVPTYPVATLQTMTLALAEAGITLRQSERNLHAKFLLWKNALLITSFNFLSATPARGVRGSEIGILLRGHRAVSAFTDRLKHLGVNMPAGPRPQRRRSKRRRRRQLRAA